MLKSVAHAGHHLPLPLVIIGGYLGAGKTTLINHVLRQANGVRVAVLVNDFGSISIDADLIANGGGANAGVLALAGGCVCCSYGEDLLGTLAKAASLVPTPDVLLLECSGVGLPAAVARTVGLSAQVRLAGVAVVVDSVDLPQRLRAPYVGDTVAQQVRAADLLLLNQADRASLAQTDATQALCCQLAPLAPQVGCARGQVPAELLLGLDGAARLRRLANTNPDTNTYTNTNRHTHTQASEHFRFEDIWLPGAQDVQAVVAGLLAAGVVRAKGLVMGHDGQPWWVQVMGARSEVRPAPAGVGLAHLGHVVAIHAIHVLGQPRTMRADPLPPCPP